MILPARVDEVPKKSEFTLTLGAAFASQQVRVSLDAGWPIDAIYIFVTMTQYSTAPTAIAGDGLLNFLKRINLQVSDPKLRTVIDVSGAGLLDWAWNVGGGLDNDTLYQYAHMPVANATPKTAFANNEICTMVYPVYLAHPQLVDPLRMFTLLPCHRHAAAPLLTLDFASYAELDLNQVPASASMEIVVVSRDMSADADKFIMDRGGYLSADLLENVTSIPADNTDLRTEIAQPGNYSGLLIRGWTNQYLRGDVLKAATDSWYIDQGGVRPRRIKASHLKAINQRTMGTNPVPVANPCYPQGSYFLDFLTDDTGTDANELGSCLDAGRFGPQVKTQLCGSVAGGTYNQVKVLGHRFWGDTNRFKQQPGK